MCTLQLTCTVCNSVFAYSCAFSAYFTGWNITDKMYILLSRQFVWAKLNWTLVVFNFYLRNILRPDCIQGASSYMPCCFETSFICGFAGKMLYLFTGKVWRCEGFWLYISLNIQFSCNTFFLHWFRCLMLKSVFSFTDFITSVLLFLQCHRGKQ